MKLNDIRMSVKLPVAFVALSFCVTLAVSWLGYQDFKNALRAQKIENLTVVTQERASTITDWINRLDAELMDYAVNPATVSAIEGFTTTFGLLMEDPEAELQAAYIDNNPNPIGQKDVLDRAEDTIPYNFQHATFHPQFRSLKNRLNLYDVFLIDTEGTILYSVYKERDFATNLETGPYRDSSLAKVFRAARAGQVGENHFADFAPYAPSAGAPASFLASPVANKDGTVLGVLAIQLPSSSISAITSDPLGLGRTGEITLIGTDLRARSASRFEDGFAVFDQLQPNTNVQTAFEIGQAIYEYAEGINGELAMGTARTLNFHGADWVIIGEMNVEEVYEAAIRQRNKVLFVTLLAMIGVGTCGWFFSKTFSAPLTQVANAMQRISNRQYENDLPDLSRKDEIGELSVGLAQVADRLQEFDERLETEKEAASAQKFAVDELAAGLQRLANQDLSQALHREFAAEYEPLRSNFNETLERLGETIANLKQFAKTLETQTDQIGREAGELSQRTENQASTLEETAAALDQVTGNISESSTDLREAEKLILETDSQVKQGRSVVENTTQAMDAIEKSSQEISSIIRVVDDIAFQTNLLALNAGVEAARAGDAGRGFAVVASEVRQLAMRSAEAVSQIKGLIETSSGNVEKGVTLVRDTESVLLEIVRRMEGISTAVTSVTSSADEQSTNIAEINAGVNNLDRVTQQNAMMVETSNTSLQALSQEAANLTEMLSSFKTRDTAGNVTNMENARFATRRRNQDSYAS